MPSSPLHVGIIGFGRIGNEHAGWIAAAGAAGAPVKAVAVADGTPARADLARSKGLRVHTTVEGLLDDADVQAVLVATPTAMHFEHAMAALASGRHVMVEKPMALDLPASRAMVEDAAARGLTLSVFHNRRWDLDYLTLRLAVQGGQLGKVINVESRLGQWSSCVGPAAREYRPNWRNEAAFGGGGLYDWGSHFVDQIWRLLWPARPVRVFAQLRGNVWSTDCDDFARLCVDFDDGTAAMVEINTTTARPLPRWHVDAAGGSVDSPHSPEFSLEKWAELDVTPAGREPNAFGAVKRLAPAREDVLTEPQIWARFAAACLVQGAPAVDPRSVLCTMALMDAARVSAREGRAIDVSQLVEWVY